MTVSELLADLIESLEDEVVGADGVVMTLVRQTEVPLDAEAAWIEVPVSQMEFDRDECRLYMQESSDEPELGLGSLRSALEAAPPEAADYDVYVVGVTTDMHQGWRVRPEVPVIGSVQNAGKRLFGVMPEYQGYEAELGFE